MAVDREEILELCRTNPEAIIDIIERQDRIITQLTEKIAQREARIAELGARLNRTSRNSSQPLSMDGFRKNNRPVLESLVGAFQGNPFLPLSAQYTR